MKYGHSWLGQALPVAFSFSDIKSNPPLSKPLGKKLRRLCYPRSYGACLLWVTDTAQYMEPELRRALLGANVGKVCVFFNVFLKLELGEGAPRKALNDWQAAWHLRINKIGEIPDLRLLPACLGGQH